MLKRIHFFLCFLLINSVMLPSYKLTHAVGTQGFFSTFNTILGALDYYENEAHGKGLEVNFGDSGLFYDKDHGSNWWEYYFEPIRLGAIDQIHQEFKPYQKIIFSLSAQFGMSRIRGNELIKKYITLKPFLAQKINSFVQEHFNGYTVIGIHYRGTDKKQEAPTITYEYVKNIVLAEAQDPHVKFFIATDDANFLEYMQVQFPNQIIATDVLRSKDEKAVHWPRSENMYKKGEDAVVDCILLSQCSKLYKMASNLSDVSLKFNPTLPVIHLNTEPSSDCQSEKYSPIKALNTVLSLLHDYENGTCEGATINFPIKNAPSGTTKYGDKEGTNWWEYHFMPLSFGTRTSKTVMPAYQQTTLGLKTLFNMQPEAASKLINKYIRIKPHIMNNIDSFASQYFSNHNVIGVHYMKQIGIFQDFLQPSVPYANVISHLEETIAKTSEKIALFVHTNDVQFLDLLKQKFQNVVYYHEPIDPEDKQMSLLEKEEISLINCVLLSKANSVMGTSTELLRVVSQFNPNVTVQKLDTLWLEAE